MIDGQAIAGQRAHNVRSLWDFAFEPSVIRKLYKSYGQGFGALDLLRSLGRYEQVSNETFSAMEEVWDEQNIVIGPNNISVAGAQGATASFELADECLDTDGNYYPRENFTVTFGSTALGFIQATITSITQAVDGTVTVVVEPWDASKTLSADYVFAGAEVAVNDSAWAAETGQPKGTVVGWFEREFYAQILKDTISFGGMELAKQMWHKKEGVGLFNAELVRGEFKLDRQEEAALLMGQPNTNSITQQSQVTQANVPVYKNKGVYTWIAEKGHTLSYNGTTDIQIPDFDEAAEYFESVGITDDIVLVLCGGSYLRRVENSGIKFMANPIDTTASGGGLPGDYLESVRDGSKTLLNMNFGTQAVQKGGITFVFKKLPIFSNPTQFGLSGYKLNDAAIMVPVTTVKEAKSGVRIPNLHARYVGLNGYSRKRIMATLGGMDGFAKQRFGDPVVSEIDGNNTYWLSHVSFPFFEAWKGILHQRND